MQRRAHLAQDVLEVSTTFDRNPRTMQPQKMPLDRGDHGLRIFARSKDTIAFSQCQARATESGSIDEAVQGELCSVADDGLHVLDIDHVLAGCIQRELVDLAARQGAIRAKPRAIVAAGPPA